MAARQLSGWQIVTLIMAFAAVIAVAAVALIMGKDAVIAIAVILVRHRLRVLVPERLNPAISAYLRLIPALRK
jgi:hypothetical protein